MKRRRALLLALVLSILLYACAARAEENACAHENIETWEDVVGTYASVDDQAHEVTGNRYRFSSCTDCGAGLGRVLLEEGVTFSENHHYYRYNEETDRIDYVGVCERCGHENACTHENAEHWTDVVGEAMSINDKEHSVTGEKVEVMHCPDCDVGIDVYTGETATITENHQYHRYDEETGRNDYVGVCETCGHENACAHENANHSTRIDGEATSISDKEHSVTGEKVEFMYCPDCEIGVNVYTGENATITENHHYYRYDEETGRDDYVGVCDWCGHENECTHEDADRWTDVDGEATSIDDKEHSVTGEKVEVMHCPDCDVEFREYTGETVTITESHYYLRYDEENECDVYVGVCDWCGHENACTHEGADHWIDADGESTSIDDKEHSVTGEKIEFMYCPDCDVEFREYTGKMVTITENHHYYRHDNETGRDEYVGVCERCGHENACAHEGADHWTDADGEATSIDDKEHSATGEKVEVMHCPDCDVGIDVYTGETVTITENHQYYRYDEETGRNDYVGVCETCGHENACTHENSEHWTHVEGEATSIDDKEHSVTGEKVEVMHCPDCDVGIDVYTGETTTITENHQYYRYNEETDRDDYVGVCERCGHENACTHENAEHWTEVEGEATSIDDKEHSATGERIECMRCADCDVECREYTGETVTITENHHYYRHNDETGRDEYVGVCERCGHENACAHEGADHWTDADGEATSIDDKEHSATGEKIEGMYCPSCDVGIDVYTGETVTITENHQYYRYDEETGRDDYVGVCERCGHENACTHENAEHWTHVEGEATSIDDKEHSVTGEKVEVMHCPDCDVGIDVYTGETTTITENHQYYRYNEETDRDDYVGVCERCGHENACTHENAEHWTDVDGEATSIDDKEHSATGEKIEFVYCPDCDVEFREYTGKMVTITENHYYYRHNDETGRDEYVGVCERCGHENACAHEGADHWTDADGEATSIDDKEHSVSGEKIEGMYCPSCDVGIDVYTGETTTITENHHYYRHDNETGRDEYVGVCERCGHENACAHEGADHWTDVDGEATSIDDKEHSVTGEKVEWLYCPNCDAGIDVRTGETVTITEEHEYYREVEEGIYDYVGVCERCGHENQCEHANIVDSNRKYIYIDAIVKFEAIDGEMHLVYGPVYRQLVCEQCGVSMGERLEEENGSIALYHEFENGICLQCGWDEWFTGYTKLELTGAVKADATIVYGYPSREADQFATAAAGDRVEIIAEVVSADGLVWYEICWNGGKAYIEKELVEFPKEPEKAGWVQESGKWYYYENGAALTERWMKDSAGWCYLGADGAMVTNAWVMDSKGWCYLGENGYAVTNCWKQDSTGWCYLDSEGSMTKNAWVQTDGKWYFLDENGYRVTNSWRKDSTGWCYLGSDGAMVTNAWVMDSKGWCYLGENGYAVTNCWKQDSAGWCYLDGEGSMTKNAWVETDSQTYYLNADGYRVTNAWVEVGGKWYYLDENGCKVTNAWRQDSIGWVYVGSDGAMVTNAWTQDSAGWCYMGSDGYAVTNCWKHDGTGWRYLGANGSMVKSAWIQLDGQWYYLNGDGYMTTGTATIDGVEYIFGEDGALAA